jgi:tRNA threonylcarbamoyladenosine biosynthesis protein TsaE
MINTEEEMLTFGMNLSRHISLGTIIYLHGDLGAGKTTLVRGVLRGLNYNDKVKSPTYTLVESYPVQNATLYHLDLYRLHDAAELAFIGIEEYFSEKSITFIEWPSKGSGFLPAADLECYIDFVGLARKIKLVAHTSKGLRIDA